MNIWEIISALIALVGAGLIIFAFAMFMRMREGQLKRQIESGERDSEIVEQYCGTNSDGKKKRRRLFARLRTAVFWVIIALFIPFIALSLASGLNKGRPVAPIGIMAVATGSMGEVNAVNAPLAEKWQYDGFGQYSIIVVERVDDPMDISLYDIIAYVNDEGLTIIHRVVAIDGEGDDVRYTMRGDANGTDDDYRPTFSDVICRYGGSHVEKLGIVVLFMQSYAGIITVVALTIILIICDGSLRRTEGCKKRRAEVLADKMRAEERKIPPCGKEQEPCGEK